MDRDLLGLSSSLGFIDELYERFQEEPSSVDPSWARLLGGPGPQPQKGNGHGGGNGHSTSGRHRTVGHTSPPAIVATGMAAQRDLAVVELVHEYRERGHLAAVLDPL